MKEDFMDLLSEIETRRVAVAEYLAGSSHTKQFAPEHIRDAVWQYLKAEGKSLRPAVLLLSCGAAGGDETVALPAAAAIEVFHTWTLVHDDIIDRDASRRGAPTVHEEFSKRAIGDLGVNETEAEHYGLAIAIVAGDLQQAWSMALLTDLSLKYGLDPTLVLKLIVEMTTHLYPTLVDGETLDVQYSKGANHHLSENLITEMLWKKTGVLYETAGRMGAAIGIENSDSEIPLVKAISTFCSKCGIAFQIQDDILGLIGDEAQLGKPIGSDIREGKSTLIALKMLENGDAKSKSVLQRVMGNAKASQDEIEKVVEIAYKTRALDYADRVARRYIEEAIQSLATVPESNYKRILLDWAQFVIERVY